MQTLEKALSTPSNWTLYRRLLTYVYRYPTGIAAALIGFIVYGASNAALARMMGWLVDSIHKESLQTSMRLMLPLAVVVIFAARGLGSFLGTYGMEYVSRKLVNTLRIEVFGNMLRLPARYFDRHSSGHLVSRVTYHVEQVTSASTSSLKTILEEGCQVLALFGSMLWLNWRLTMVFLIVMPFIALIVNFVSKRFRVLSKRIQHSVGEVTHVAGEVLNGYRVVRTHNAEQHEYQRFARVSEYNRVQSMKQTLTKAISAPVIQTLVALAMAFLFWLALSPTLMNGMTSGEFVSFITAASLMSKPVKSLTEVNGEIQKGLTAASEIFDIIDHDKEKDQGTYAPETVKGDVRFENVVFRYAAEDTTLAPALDHINLHARQGEMVALVGHSGGGKSTLVNMLPRFYDPTEGQILLDGVALSDYTLHSLRQHISLVNQNVILFNSSVLDNIAYGDEQPDRDRAIRAAKAAYADGFITKLPEGYDTPIGDNGLRLSGGQRQRLAIARAIYRDSPLLILDEATSALDTESERYIQRALEEVCKGRTTFVIAHRLSTIEKADRIIVIEQGRVIEEGTHADLLAKGGAYAALHHVQFSVQKSSSEETPAV